MQVDMRTTRAMSRSEGSVQEYRSGALAITVTLGDPSGDGGVGTFVMGGSVAFVSATGDLSSGTDDAPISFDTGILDTGSAPAPVAEIPLPTGQSVSTPPAAAVPLTPSSPQAPFISEPAGVSRFAGVGFAMPFFVLLGSLIAGRGLHDLHRSLVGAPVATRCLAEQESP
jgi:hypothetical protein